MLNARYVASLFVSFVTVVAVSTWAAPGSGSVPGGVQANDSASPAKKTCTFNGVGSEGCTVKLHMRPSGDPCSAGGLEMCVWLVVKCPGGVPSGDPEEECTSKENCEVCPTDLGTAASVKCDGQTFSAETKQGKRWGDVWDDCSAANIRVS